jgi:exonuclease VII large subunit
MLAARVERADRMPGMFRSLLDRVRVRCRNAEGVLRRLPARVAAGGHRRVLEGRRQQLSQLVRARVGVGRATIDAAERALLHLSPRKVLERGYSITTVEGENAPLRDGARTKMGQTLHTLLAKGSVRSVVAGSSGKPRPSKPKTTEQQSLFETEE